MIGQSILWRKLDQPGHDSARLWFQDPYWHLAGTAIFVEDRRPCRLDYQEFFRQSVEYSSRQGYRMGRGLEDCGV
jgi:hypothetical protein